MRISLCCCPFGAAAADVHEGLASQIHEHIDKAKHAALKEALHSTEGMLTKVIAVPAVELLQNFPPTLWQQLHAVVKQVSCCGRAAQQMGALLSTAGEHAWEQLSGSSLQGCV